MAGGSANVPIDDRTSALVHINRSPLRVHWGHIISLAPLQGNPPSQIGGIISPKPSLKEETPTS